MRQQNVEPRETLNPTKALFHPSPKPHRTRYAAQKNKHSFLDPRGPTESPAPTHACAAELKQSLATREKADREPSSTISSRRSSHRLGEIIPDPSGGPSHKAMFLLGHGCWSYFISRAAGRKPHANLPLHMAWSLSEFRASVDHRDNWQLNSWRL